MTNQLTLFDTPQARNSYGEFCDKKTLKRENELRKTVAYIHSITDFQPQIIRQLSEEIIELKNEIKRLKNENIS